MRGVLWRCLFGFGVVFWGCLCLFDYYYLGAVHLMDSLHLKMLEEEMATKDPEFTIWKGFCMVFITIFLYSMKRFSTIKTPSISKLVSPRLNISDSEMSASVDDVMHRLAQLISTNNAKMEPIGSPRRRRSPSPIPLPLVTPSVIRSVKPPSINVHDVHQRLLSLQKTVQSMKQKQTGSYGNKTTKYPINDRTLIANSSNLNNENDFRLYQH